MTVRGTARGKSIELGEALPYPPGQELKLDIQPVESGRAIGSPARLLDALRQPPHLTPADTDELEKAIESGKVPPLDRGVFDEFADAE